MKSINSKLFDSKKINEEMKKIKGGLTGSGNNGTDTAQRSNYDVIRSTASTTSAPEQDTHNTGSQSSDAPSGGIAGQSNNSSFAITHSLL